ncbi:MAG: hypothetical protein AB1489_31290 [Acidobacteriota bacterium]
MINVTAKVSREELPELFELLEEMERVNQISCLVHEYSDNPTNVISSMSLESLVKDASVYYAQS